MATRLHNDRIVSIEEQIDAVLSRLDRRLFDSGDSLSTLARALESFVNARETLLNSRS